jgi:hypothetical protein
MPYDFSDCLDHASDANSFVEACGSKSGEWKQFEI